VPVNSIFGIFGHRFRRFAADPKRLKYVQFVGNSLDYRPWGRQIAALGAGRFSSRDSAASDELSRNSVMFLRSQRSMAGKTATGPKFGHALALILRIGSARTGRKVWISARTWFIQAQQRERQRSNSRVVE
jgi:hypothetical protein